ncbi:MAG: type II secretion system protein GspD [Limisphaerales bacterium]
MEFSAAYDPQIKHILELARKDRWEEAEAAAAALTAKAPEDKTVQRTYGWVKKERQARRDKALENEIGDISAHGSDFNPSVTSLLTEKKDRGLAPRKDVRDAVEQIESARYIPSSYGKTIQEKGPLFDFETSKGPMAAVLGKEVSLHLDNATLESIIFNVGQAQGINFVADKSLPAFQQKLSVSMDKVKVSEFLRYVSRNLDVQFQVGSNLVWIVDAKGTNRALEETRFYRLRKGFVLPAQFGAPEATKQSVTVNAVTTTTELQKFQKFVNDEAPVLPAIERAITNLFTGSRYLIDYERNLIVARGTLEQLEVLERIIQEFDRPIQQVLIEARFVTISKPAFMQLGALWETGRQNQSSRVPQDFTGLVNDQNIGNMGVGIQGSFTNVLGRSDLSATISALEQTGESQTLSAPRLTVLNNRPASISDGKVQYYYEEYQVQTTVGQFVTASSWVPQGKPTKITAGSQLNVLASISGDGKHILLALNPVINSDVQVVTYATLSNFDQNGNRNSSFDVKLPQYRTQELATRLVIKSGETVVMGGVLERAQSTVVESIPLLGSIPILGAAFRRRTDIDQPRYLLIFVTATLLSDTGEYLIYDDTP